MLAHAQANVQCIQATKIMRRTYMLDLRNLRHFVVLARRLNYVRAADELSVTQPTLSRSIQSLERQLQVRLFDRNRGGVTLTPQGRVIAERAGFLLTDAEDLESYSKLTAQGESGRIRFGMAPMPAHALLRQVLTDRLNVAPNVINEVVVRDIEALWGLLIAGEIEFFVCPDRPLHDLSQARVEILGSFPLSVIVCANHPLLENQLEDRRFPLLRSSWTGVSIPHEIQHRILGAPNVVEDFATLAGITASTNALWLSSSYAVRRELKDGSLVELLRARQHVDVGLYTLKRRSQSPLAESIAALLRDYVRTLEE
jgi:DNA-binding transcriptional LysR family regulator